MPDPFKPGAKYLVDGSTLNDWERRLAESRIIFTDSVKGRVIRGQGTVLHTADHGGSAGACEGFVVSVDPDTGEITATESGVTYSGDFDSGYTEPTWAGTGNALPDGGGTVSATGTFYAWSILSYAAATSEFGTPWEITDVEFDFGAAVPGNTKPTYDFSTQTWSGSGTRHTRWAKIVDREVQWSFGGGMIAKICDPDNIIIQHGCQI